MLAKAQVFASTKNPYTAGNGDILGVSISSPVKVVNTGRLPLLIEAAIAHPRKRKMTDLTKDPAMNGLQILLNTWTEGSYSPVHMHPDFSEAFTILEGALAFFTFTEEGAPTCHILDAGSKGPANRVLIVEKGQYHAMTAAPRRLGYEGHAVVFENSGHLYDPTKETKALAPFSKVVNQGLDGDPEYFDNIMRVCMRRI